MKINLENGMQLDIFCVERECFYGFISNIKIRRKLDRLTIGLIYCISLSIWSMWGWSKDKQLWRANGIMMGFRGQHNIVGHGKLIIII